MSNSTTDLLEECRLFLTPNPDIAGIGVRLSVYLQTFLAWVLLFFHEADDLIDGTYKNAGLTIYAIALALALTDGSHSSVQTDVVLHSFVMILIFSLFAMMAFRTFLRGKMYVISLLGTLPLAIWLFYLAIKEIKDKHCYEFTVVSRAAKSYTPLFIIFWAVSLSLYIFALPCFSLLFFNKTRTRLARMPQKLVPMAIWFVIWFFMVVACEVATHSFQFRESDYQLTPLTAQEWQFGQVMAVVMLFLQLYDVCTYPFRESRHGGKRILYWWAYEFKPFWSRHVRRDGRADGECDFTSDECQKPGCICRVKRENTVVENGKIPIVVGRITS